MTGLEEKSIVVMLVITDGVFGNQCTDSSSYVAKLKDVLSNKETHNVQLVSVSGNRGISDIDSSIPALDLDTKNKTQFVQSLENNVGQFDELLIIKDADDLFLSGARQAVTELNKPIRTYGYTRKQK